MKEGDIGWGQIVVSHYSKRGFDFWSNSIDYLLVPVFETGLFLGVLFLLLCAAFCFCFTEEPCVRVLALAASFRGVALDFEAFIF